MSSPIGSRILAAVVVTATCLTLTACGGGDDDKAPTTPTTVESQTSSEPEGKQKPAGWSTESVLFKSTHMVELDAYADSRDVNHFGYQLCGAQNFSIELFDSESRLFLTCTDPTLARKWQAKLKQQAKR